MDDLTRQLIKRFLAGKKAAALEWLRGCPEGSFRNLGEMEAEESVDFVRRLYDLGAEQVLAVEVDEYPDGANTGHLLVQLPSDAAARQRLFAFDREHAESLGFEGDPDEGQEYLYLMLD
jgi:hypothetical protein